MMSYALLLTLPTEKKQNRGDELCPSWQRVFTFLSSFEGDKNGQKKRSKHVIILYKLIGSTLIELEINKGIMRGSSFWHSQLHEMIVFLFLFAWVKTDTHKQYSSHCQLFN